MLSDSFVMKSVHLVLARVAALATVLCLAACAGSSSNISASNAAATVPHSSTQAQASVDKNAPREVRGVWLTNVDSNVLDSRENIAEAMQFLADHHFNVVYPVVWNKAATLYPSAIMQERFGQSIDPRFAGRDPLREVIEEAHARGLEVVPWFEFGFSCWHTSLGPGGGPIVKKYPHWAAKDQEGKIATKNGFEWLNGLHPEVQDFLLSLILEVANTYEIDGVQGDDRLPAMPSLAGYDAWTVAQYRAEKGKEPPTDYKDPEWVQWRADRLTGFLARLRREVKAVDEHIVISMSPSYYDWSLYEYLQDSKTWVDRGLVDTLHPQAYRYELDAYRKIVDDLVANQFTDEQLPLLSPGLLVKSGSYVIDPAMLLECIAYNRANGVQGEVHFFYEGLRKNDNAVATALLNGPYKQKAGLPYR
ncbi:MAG: hypothetical protein PWP23_1393 [Candidatus Sumerlaeota bacterium]|nr:hypothetical protein [Candidatus Sumerlaeota bacterium]